MHEWHDRRTTERHRKLSTYHPLRTNAVHGTVHKFKIAVAAAQTPNNENCDGVSDGCVYFARVAGRTLRWPPQLCHNAASCEDHYSIWPQRQATSGGTKDKRKQTTRSPLRTLAQHSRRRRGVKGAD